MMIEFKEITTQEDITNIHKLADEIWREYYADILIQGQIEYMITNFQSVEAINQQIQQGYEYFQIINEKDIVGYFATVHKDDNNAYRLHNKAKTKAIFLSKFYIAKSHRCKGIGKLVIRHLKKTACSLGFSKIWLAVNKNNLNSMNAYKKMGFKIYREGCEEIGCGYRLDDYFMELNTSCN